MLVVFVGCFYVLFLIQLAYWIFYYIQFRQIKASNLTANLNYQEPVTVLICAHNEQDNITTTVHEICQQEHSHFQVIVIDDNSTDDTWDALTTLKTQYANLRIFKNHNTRNWKGKKSALDYGIQKALTEAILVTDADCRPKSKYWISQMMSLYQGNIVLGYAPYYVGNIAFLPQWIQWETLHTWIQYSTYAQAGHTYMGVGRNMIYPKSTYDKAINNPNFIETYNSVPSGDDDLLLQEMIKHTTVQIQAHQDSFMYSIAPMNWNDYWKQKTRHASTGKYYAVKSKLALGLFAMTHSMFWLFSFGLIIYIFVLQFPFNQPKRSFMMEAVTFPILLYIGVYRTIWVKIYQYLYGNHLKPNFLLRGNVFWSIYNLILSPYIFYKNKQRWK